ncbi:MAG TPA: PqqD family protein [Chthonomonadaceae bacterium]|nr:PqqD family protein [Chthonomonadaceae bacterium]
MKSPAMTPLLPRRRDLPSSPVGRELMVRDPESGQVHFFNAAARFIWDSCDGATSIRECAMRLRAEFSVPETVDLQADIAETLADFSQKGLLTC